MTYIFKPLDGSLIFYLHPEGSRRLDSKVTNLAVNPDNRLFSSLNFDGIDDIVNCGNNASLNVSSAMTLTMWIYRRPPRYILDMPIGKTGSYVLQIDTSSNKFGWWGTIGGSTIDEYPANAPVLYKWTFIGMRYNGSRIRYTVNNVTTDGRAVSGNIIATVHPLYVGNTSTRTYNSNSLISTVRLYNRYLSDAEMLSLSHFEQVDNTGLVAYYPGNGQGSTLTDYSGNNNHGTIYGATWQDGKINGTLSGGVTYKNSPSNNPVYNFDGTGYIRATPVRSARTNMSVFTWARASEESYLLGRYDTGLSNRSWIIGTDVAGEKRLRILLSDDGTYGASHSKDYLTTANVFDGSWHMYGFTWNAGTLKLFVDGREQSVTKTYDAAFTTLKSATTDLVIGARFINGSPAAYYTGQQGHQWIFNRTLLSSDAMQLFNETRRYYGR